MEAEHEMLPLLEIVFRRNIQFVRVEEQSKVHMRGEDDGTVYYHLMPACGSKKWRESKRGGGRATKMMRTTNRRWNESKEMY